LVVRRLLQGLLSIQLAPVHFALNLFLQKEAIGYSWEILTDVYKLPKDRLYVTYFEGDPKNGLGADEEARQIWLDRGVAEDHILPGNAKDNFWGTCLSIPLHQSR
jgi:alanyl-tRNA synthetase